MTLVELSLFPPSISGLCAVARCCPLWVVALPHSPTEGFLGLTVQVLREAQPETLNHVPEGMASILKFFVSESHLNV